MARGAIAVYDNEKLLIWEEPGSSERQEKSIDRANTMIAAWSKYYQQQQHNEGVSTGNDIKTATLFSSNVTGNMSADADQLIVSDDF